jgi:membrane associated rhomboid family serine protease
VVSNALIAINVGLFIWMTLGAVGSGIFGTTSTDRTMDFVISRIFLEQGEWYRLVSCGFVHFGVIHVGFNMVLLYQLGRLIEPVIGSLRFGLLYFAALRSCSRPTPPRAAHRVRCSG